MKTGIFFDLDGTLWDAVENITISWNDELRRQGYPIVLSADTLQKEMGKLMEDIADSVFPTIEKEKRYGVLRRCMDYEMEYLKTHGGRLYDDLEDTLKILSSKYFLCVISNGQEDYVKNFLDYYGFHQYFSDYEEAGRTGMAKAENIRLVMERNHLEKAFYVGDILADMQAADKAGATFIHAAYGFGTAPADRPKINRISDLPDLMIQLLIEDKK